MAQLRGLMAQAMAQGKPLMAQGNGTNGTSHSTENGHIQDTEIQEDTEIQLDPSAGAGDTAVSDFDFDFNWPQILKALRQQMTQATYDASFHASTAVLEDGIMVITVPNQYAADRINGRLQTTVERAVAAYTGRTIPIFARQQPLTQKSSSVTYQTKGE
jgi:uncharacterized protein YukJ